MPSPSAWQTVRCTAADSFSGFTEGPRNQQLVGKRVDLESAYRQLAIDPAHRHLTVICLKNPQSGKEEFFLSKALSFGASSAVHSFTRAAHALETILVECFGIPCTHYFDDFTVIVPESMGEIVVVLMHEALSVLGWETKAEKEHPMRTEFNVLGVTFDVKRALGRQGKLVIRNTPDRTRGMVESIGRILAADSLAPHEAARLRGRMIFANAQMFGRAGALASHYLGRRATLAGNVRRLDAELRWCLEWWRAHLFENAPREVPLVNMQRPIFVFTDGACEEDVLAPYRIKGSYGAVFFDPADNTLEALKGVCGREFACILSEDG